MLPGKRALKVGDKIHKEISILLLDKVKDPRVKDVTITGIRLSNNLKHALVYFSVMGDDVLIERAKAGLDSAKGFLKRELGLRMQLRYVPDVTFLHDPSLKRGSDMERLFEKIRSSESNNESDKVT